MKAMKHKKIEMGLIIGIGVLIIVLLGATVMMLYTYRNPKNRQSTEEKNIFTQKLADQMDHYPDKIDLNEPVPELTFYSADGEKVFLSGFKGKNVILLYWASWCKYCKKEFKNLDEYEKVLENYKDVELILINKLDGEKETKESALEYLKDSKLSLTNYFDDGLMVYQSLGIKIVPTMLGIDKDGIVKLCHPGNITDSNEFTAFVEYIRNGAAFSTERFVADRLTSPAGGVHSNYYDNKEAAPSGYDVLSESQGVMLEYAVQKNNPEMFGRYYDFIRQKMLITDSLSGWVLTADGVSKVNALVDEFRIYKALHEANQLWGGYEEALAKMNGDIYQYNTDQSRPIDYYDFSKKKKADRITLCYLDLETMALLKESKEEYASVYEGAYTLLTKGYIGDNFPLYYSWYDYSANGYQKDDLNMAEAMLTLLHLARIGELKQQTADWLRNALENGGIKARYTIAGEVADGYNYESTAVYATAAMIGREINDDKIETLAIARMEETRVNDNNSDFNGAFTQQEGKDIVAYDQLMPLLAYSYLEQE